MSRKLHITVATADTFAKLVSQPGIVLFMTDIDGGTYRCDGPIRRAFRVTASDEKLAAAIYLDLGKYDEVVPGIDAIPYFSLYRDGTVVDSLYRPHNRREFEAWYAKAMNALII
jgi:hypothetical protein